MTLFSNCPLQAIYQRISIAESPLKALPLLYEFAQTFFENPDYEEARIAIEKKAQRDVHKITGPQSTYLSSARGLLDKLKPYEMTNPQLATLLQDYRNDVQEHADTPYEKFHCLERLLYGLMNFIDECYQEPDNEAAPNLCLNPFVVQIVDQMTDEWLELLDTLAKTRCINLGKALHWLRQLHRLYPLTRSSALARENEVRLPPPEAVA